MNKIKTIFFIAQWCKICKILLPYFRHLSTKYNNIDFLIIDLDKNPKFKEYFNIKEYPTFLILKDNRELHRIEGGYIQQVKILLDNIIKNGI
jgi:thioredoxin 1